MPSLEQQRATRRRAAAAAKQQPPPHEDEDELPEDVARDFATASSSLSFRAHAGTAAKQNGNSSGSKLKRSASEARRAEGFWSHLDDSPMDRLDVAISRLVFSLNLGYVEVRDTTALLNLQQ